jgi:hypothetical protein
LVGLRAAGWIASCERVHPHRCGASSRTGADDLAATARRTGSCWPPQAYEDFDTTPYFNGRGFGFSGTPVDDNAALLARHDVARRRPRTGPT